MCFLLLLCNSSAPPYGVHDNISGVMMVCWMIFVFIVFYTLSSQLWWRRLASIFGLINSYMYV